ncbi:osteocalcin 2 [Drosophila eugracilis]|uniref:osteocalcin 2 n=1 Tax=Drosophila eugracilis TaxID=29029 RepID=UPI0007E6E652|nr:osteocalcin 2 [Drosophila eugracilis]
MKRSVLLLALLAILFCAAVAHPAVLSKSEEDWLEQMLAESVDSGELQDVDESNGNHISKRSAKDSSSSEEHKNGANDKVKDKANSSGDSSSEETTTTTTERSARKRRSICEDLSKFKIKSSDSDLQEVKEMCALEYRTRRGATEQNQGRDQKISEESELDAQAEKELDEEMARVATEILTEKDNTSIEDYAQGCEVMEVSSKEANEATYAE